VNAWWTSWDPSYHCNIILQSSCQHFSNMRGPNSRQITSRHIGTVNSYWKPSSVCSECSVGPSKMFQKTNTTIKMCPPTQCCLIFTLSSMSLQPMQWTHLLYMDVDFFPCQYIEHHVCSITVIQWWNIYAPFCRLFWEDNIASSVNVFWHKAYFNYYLLTTFKNIHIRSVFKKYRTSGRQKYIYWFGGTKP
jgi:hypothetical protein